MLIGCARVSTDEQDTTAQTIALRALGVDADRIYVDQGLTRRNRNLPTLTAALSACRQGDTSLLLSSIGSHGPCPMLETLPTSWRAGECVSVLVVRSTTRRR